MSLQVLNQHLTRAWTHLVTREVVFALAGYSLFFCHPPVILPNKHFIAVPLQRLMFSIFKKIFYVYEYFACIYSYVPRACLV